MNQVFKIGTLGQHIAHQQQNGHMIDSTDFHSLRSGQQYFLARLTSWKLNLPWILMEVRQAGSNFSLQSMGLEINLEEYKQTTPFQTARLQRLK